MNTTDFEIENECAVCLAPISRHKSHCSDCQQDATICRAHDRGEHDDEPHEECPICEINS